MLKNPKTLKCLKIKKKIIKFSLKVELSCGSLLVIQNVKLQNLNLSSICKLS